MGKFYDSVVVSVGKVPDWYIENAHNFYLKISIKEEYEKVADDVLVDYNYEESLVLGFNEFGEQITKHPVDLQHHFVRARAGYEEFLEIMNSKIKRHN